MAKIKRIYDFEFAYQIGNVTGWKTIVKYSFSTLRKKNAKRGVHYGKRIKD